MAFQFPAAPALLETVVNPITGSTYQWRDDLNKWILVRQTTQISEIIWEGDSPPDPIGDYKLWYSTDTLELYFWYEDENGVGAWVPTSVPIQVLEDLNACAAQAEVDIDQLQYKQQLLQNALDQIYLEVQTAAAQRPPIFSTTEPDKHPDFTPPKDELITGDIWYDNTDADSLKQYIYDGTEWVEFGNQFVLREGDSMTGDLLMQDADIKMNDGDIVFQPIVPDGDADGARPERWNSLVSKRVRDSDDNVIGGSNDFGIRVDLTEGRTGYNKFEFYSNVDGESPSKFADFGGGNNPSFRFKRGNFQMEGNRIQKLGNAEVDTDAVSLGQVKDELKDFKSEIIEQAAVGIFKWDTQSSNTTPLAGCFFGKQDATNATEPFINNFRVSNEDINGANQDFSTWEVGDIITWTNTINSAYQIRYRVNSVPTFQNGHYYFEVSYISQTNLFMQGQDFILTRQQFTNIDFSDLEETYLRLDADNGPLTGNLQISTEDEFGAASLKLSGYRDNKNNSAATIAFENTHSGATGNDIGYITFYHYGDVSTAWFGFNRNIDLKGNDITEVHNLKLQNPGSIYAANNERIKFKTSSSDSDGSGIIEIQRPTSTPRRGLTIRGKNTSNNDTDIFFTYTNSTGGDAINYKGKQTDNSDNLATTKYVKTFVENKLDFSKYNELS